MHADLALYGAYGEVVNTSDCGSDMRAFEPRYAPHLKSTSLQCRDFFLP